MPSEFIVDEFTRFRLPLQDGREAHLVLPEDLTTTEAEHIAGIVKALAVSTSTEEP